MNHVNAERKKYCRRCFRRGVSNDVSSSFLLAGLHCLTLLPVRWSLYELDRAHDRVDYIPTAHRAGNMGYLRMFAHDLLPLYVEKVSDSQ